MTDTAGSFIRPEEFWKEIGLRAGQVVVHLGSGAGFYLLPAAAIVGKEGKAIGVDVVPDMLAEVESKARLAGVEDVVQTLRSNVENEGGSGIPEKSADWVLLANILHQSSPEKVLAEAKRIVSMSGRIVIVEWDVAASPLGPPDSARIAKPDMLALLESAGLQLVSEVSPSPYHYGLIVSPQGS